MSTFLKIKVLILAVVSMIFPSQATVETAQVMPTTAQVEFTTDKPTPIPFSEIKRLIEAPSPSPTFVWVEVTDVPTPSIASPSDSPIEPTPQVTPDLTPIPSISPIPLSTPISLGCSLMATFVYDQGGNKVVSLSWSYNGTESGIVYSNYMGSEDSYRPVVDSASPVGSQQGFRFRPSDSSFKAKFGTTECYASPIE